MKNFSINELSNGGSESGGASSGPLRSPAVLTSSGSGGVVSSSSVTGSSSPINPSNHPPQHHHPHHSAHYAPSSVTTINMTQPSLDCTPVRLAQMFYQNGNDHQQSSISMHGAEGNINWRDEADGSEEDELRLNLMAASPMDLPLPPPPSPPTESPPGSFSMLDGPSTSFVDTEDTDRFGNAPSNNLNTRPANPPWSQQAKEKRLRETEFYLSQMENVIESFRKLLRSNEWSQHNQNMEERDNAKRAAETLPKMINISNLRASEDNSANNNHNRNNKNRMQTQYNNNPFYSLPHVNNHELSDNIFAGDPFEPFPDRPTHSNFANHIGLEPFDTEPRSYRFEENSDMFSYFKMLNQQVYKLLMFNNQQINQNQQLIWSWISCQQKWLESQALISSLRGRTLPTGHFGEPTDPIQTSNSPHYQHHQSATLNNQTVPGTRANNFWDNFKSQSCQNNIQPNRVSRTHLSQNSPSNCTNSCLNTGPCNKNNRSQSLSSFYTASNKSSQVNTRPNNLNTSVNLNQNNNSLPELDKNSKKMQQYKKMVSDFEKLLGECRLLTNTTTESRFFDLPSTSSGVPSQTAFKFTLPELGGQSQVNQNGLKRKKLSNIDLNATEPHEDGCECDGNDNNYFDIQLNQDRQRVKANLASRLFVTPHPSGIPKKPLTSNLVKFSATDSAKLMQQHGVGQEEGELTSGSGREHVRPLMPAEGRSSEQRFLGNNAISVQLKLPKSTPKFSIRPPIAGNETNSIHSNSVTYGPESKSVQNTEVHNSPLKEKKNENILNGNGNHDSEQEEPPNLDASSDSVHLETDTEIVSDGQMDSSSASLINGPKNNETNRQDSSRSLLNGTRSTGGEGHQESDEAIHTPLNVTSASEVRLSGDGEQGL